MKDKLKARETKASKEPRVYSIARGQQIPLKDQLETILSMHRPGGTLAATVVLRFSVSSRDGTVYTYILDKRRFPLDNVATVPAFKVHLRRHAEITGGRPV